VPLLPLGYGRLTCTLYLCPVFGEYYIVSTTIKINVCRDEADNRVLECALDGGGDSIVTGDNDLLDLKAFKGIRIVRINDLPF
jgi:predicted nucleic acid-binding protein